MDTITHVALGAIIGEALVGKQLGKKAMIYGALAQTLPDIDSLAVLWLSPVDNLLAHRGLTHSFLFALIMSSILAFGAHRWHYSITRLKWILFFSVQLFTHILIDSLNAYGTGWFEPFSHHRFSYHLLFVADPFFSVPLVIACIMLMVISTDSPKRSLWIKFSLILSSAYIICACGNKLIVERDLQKAQANLEINVLNSFTTPTPFNNWLWYAVSETDSGYYTSYHSVFDTYPDTTFAFFEQNKQLLDSLADEAETKKLLQFAQGYYTVELQEGNKVFNVLRFGQINGWCIRSAPFAFHYFIQKPDENTFVVQRGRFSGWDRESLRAYIKRIQGN